MTAILEVPFELAPYQHRVVGERIALALKVNDLEKFIQGEAFVQVPVQEQTLLNEQLEHMALYLRVLDQRVAAFTGATRYTCHKEVLARPMNRLTYNVMRGWDIPADEDPTDEGYLVEYLDGGAANHPDFAGYISWSPKDVFERGYTENS